MIDKKYIPGFPSCRIEFIQKILRRIHCFLFKEYYDVRIPGGFLGDKPVYIWNGGPKN